MKRFYLKKGDRSSNGGVVLEGMDFFMHHGTPVTFLGAKVYCSACESTGVIVGQGPRWPDSLMGKHAALEGDPERCLESCDERVRVVDHDGKPLSGVPYHIRTASGVTYKGLTDSQGSCPRVHTDNPQQLDIAIGFQALQRWAG
ncbi:PAAR domain-containing protein [Burkholderia cenocepacia]|uniref:PAAR domain-containing protein n=1 Tax=Burkholderia cenocepacia TaxID=95486 RepID=UPI001B952F4D|nr:PAAR domain-containing protein [Burkholderia cenocepacia]MBR8296263.1 PAAR domain-containing protein [Burkholderia cenocepacia]